MDLVKLIGPKWADLLPKAGELLEPISERLKEEKQHCITILPEGKNIFRIFHDIPPENVRVLWIGQDAYHNPVGQATGRAFECGKMPSATWRKIAEVYKAEVEDYSPQVMQGRLDSWVEQGVFLINKALTVRHRMPNSHTRYWEPFTRYVVGTILTDLTPKAVILLGSEATKMIHKVPAPHKGFTYEHPAAASYQGRPWDAKGLFTSVNQFLTFHDKQIKW